MSQNEVQPVEGQPANPAPGPAPIPRRQLRFRAAAQPGNRIPVAPPSFPVSTGIDPLLAHAEGYASVEVPRSGLNTVIPSYMNLVLRVFYTNQRLSINDKFLKEVSLYHPDAFDLYCAFIFVYHTLIARNQVGQLSASESTLLSDMEKEYPPSSLPVPGTIVGVLQTITSTENPYPWLGNICPDVPAAGSFTSPSVAYEMQNNYWFFWPNFKFLVSQLVATAARARPTDNTWPNIANTRFTSPGAAAGNTTAPAAIRTDDIERMWLRSPHGRIPMLLNLRVAQAFHDAVLGSANAPFYSEFALDLPHMNAIAATANGTLASYIGIIDDEGVQNRTTRYRRWPSQLAPMIGTACKYISGSRYLSDIPTTGLGAMHHVARYTASVTFEVRDPAVVQGGAAAALAAATYQAFHLQGFNAILEIRDPVPSDISIQYAMLAQTNLDPEDALDSAGQPLGPAFNTTTVGPFWTYPIGENGPEASVANTLMSFLPNFVRAMPRRDAAE